MEARRASFSLLAAGERDKLAAGDSPSNPNMLMVSEEECDGGWLASVDLDDRSNKE